ncbi:MAG: alpha/beta fold hydrolase [Patescibacteria group bacterium]
MRDIFLPIVLLHGMWGNANQFANWSQFLNDCGYTVVPLTLPGHELGGNVDKLSIYNYADAIEGFLSRIGPCHLVGHSMGGLIAQMVGHHKNVRKVALVTSAAPYGISPTTLAIKLRMLRPRYLKALCTGEGYRVDDGDARWLMMNCLDDMFKPSEVFPSCESGVATWELSQGSVKVQPLKKPTLVIGCNDDRMTPVRTQEAIADLHGATYRTYAGGHLPMLEHRWRRNINDISTWLLTK